VDLERLLPRASSRQVCEPVARTSDFPRELCQIAPTSSEEPCFPGLRCIFANSCLGTKNTGENCKSRRGMGVRTPGRSGPMCWSWRNWGPVSRSQEARARCTIPASGAIRKTRAEGDLTAVNREIRSVSTTAATKHRFIWGDSAVHLCNGMTCIARGQRVAACDFRVGSTRRWLT
jgi:hypothetical protein